MKEYTQEEFEKVLCWKNQNNCQEIIREARKSEEIDAEFSVSESSFYDDNIVEEI